MEIVDEIGDIPYCVRATRAEHSRRFLSLNYAIEWVITYLQEIS